MWPALTAVVAACLIAAWHVAFARPLYRAEALLAVAPTSPGTLECFGEDTGTSLAPAPFPLRSQSELAGWHLQELERPQALRDAALVAHAILGSYVAEAEYHVAARTVLSGPGVRKPSVLQIRVEGPDPQACATLANALAARHQSWLDYLAPSLPPDAAPEAAIRSQVPGGWSKVLRPATPGERPINDPGDWEVTLLALAAGLKLGLWDRLRGHGRRVRRWVRRCA